MRWRQTLFAAALAIGAVVAALLRLEASLLVATLIGSAVYVGVRACISTLFRTRYWIARGTKGAYTRRCPDCGQRIYRKRGDWIMHCYRCGWTAGLPGLRWCTHSVPARQLRRSLSWIGFGVIVVATAAIFVAPAFGALPVIDSGAGTAAGGGSGSTAATVTGTPIKTTRTTTETATETPTATATPDPSEVQQGYDLSKVEAEFLELLNAERQSRGLQTVKQRDVLTDMGRSHSEDMAEHNYLGHEEPDGSTIQDRYRERGLLPECRLPISDSGRYYAGAENAAHFWVDETVRMDSRSFYVGSESDLARGLFRTWMNSPPHRKAMLVASADEAGLGLYIDGRGKVYASLELC